MTPCFICTEISLGSIENLYFVTVRSTYAQVITSLKRLFESKEMTVGRSQMVTAMFPQFHKRSCPASRSTTTIGDSPHSRQPRLDSADMFCMREALPRCLTRSSTQSTYMFGVVQLVRYQDIAFILPHAPRAKPPLNWVRC